MPVGSVIIIDEAYKIFPQRGPGQKKPPHVERMAELRHDAYEIILIAQSVKGQLDSFVRGLVNYHYHFVRPFGSEYANRFFWEKCQENVDGYHEKREAQTKMVKFDKKYYGAYRSAEAHTVKKRLPYSRFLGLAAAVIAALCCGYWAISTIGDLGGGAQPTMAKEEHRAVPQASQSDGFQEASFRQTPMTSEDWFQARQARVPGFAHTAPIYDEVTQPVTFPRPNCIVWDIEEREGSSECRCYSQQATRMDVPPDICLQIVKNGWFDHTRADTAEEKKYAANRDRSQRQERPNISSEPRYYGPPSSTIIGQGDHLILTSSK